MANPLSKKSLKEKYDEYRELVKAGKMTRKEMETQGRIMAASYQANKGKTKPIPKPAATKPAATKPTASKPTASTTKPTRSAQANTGTGRDGKFGTGTYGAGRKSDPKKSTKHTGGKRAQVNRKPKRDLAAGAREVSARARNMNPTPSSLPMSPAKNPKKGHRYKKPFGRVMVFNGTKYVAE